MTLRPVDSDIEVAVFRNKLMCGVAFQSIVAQRLVADGRRYEMAALPEAEEADQSPVEDARHFRIQLLT